MRIFFADAERVFRHFDDLTQLTGLPEGGEFKFGAKSRQKRVVQLLAAAEDEACVVNDIVFHADFPIYCVNTQGRDNQGREFKLAPKIPKGSFLPLFFVIDTGEEEKELEALLEIVTDKGVYKVAFRIDVEGEAADYGFDDLKSLARLDWLNSAAYIERKPAPPFPAIEYSDGTASILGRKITLCGGLPSQAESFIDESFLLQKTPQKRLLSEPMSFKIDGKACDFSVISVENDGCGVKTVSEFKGKDFTARLNSELFYDGYFNCSIALTAQDDINFEDIRLEMPVAAECARYLNGFDKRGGCYVDSQFRWISGKHWDCLFIGAENCGARIKFKAENYVKPLINVYYAYRQMKMPDETWANGGKGGISVKKLGNTAEASAYTSEFSMKKGERRSFDFEIHFTPFKPVDFKKLYAVRYYQNNNMKNPPRDLEKAKKKGLNVINIHHGTPLHPFINYPFIEAEALKSFVNAAHAENVGVKVYYTSREHSNAMAEVFAYKALGDEIIHKTELPVAPNKWICDNLGTDVIPAWQVDLKHGSHRGEKDVSFIVKPESRLENYYIEGLDWLVKKVGIDGIYIDDTALGRTAFERARKVLGHRLIDMHMWNHEEDRAGDVSCMNLYTEIYPFIDSLWVGEGFDVRELSPDYIMTEVSGLLYGQTSQMLQNGGDHFIGMLYAMNNRYGWGVKDADIMYALWDEFGIESSVMYGYWHSRAVKTDAANVLATAYAKDGEALICIFNFNEKKVNFALDLSAADYAEGLTNAEKPRLRGLQRGGGVDVKNMVLGGKRGAILKLSK